ncbi:hypothetical protein C8R47DRAFT_1228489 [Mycena vitilis]|nr:hypothetical protein C8R47DRAFT_1228489 [Mycena vitilis]
MIMTPLISLSPVMAELPQELIDAIVEEVEGKGDLQACSLTAQSFLDPSQRRLFRPMYLRWDASSSRKGAALDRALSLIHESPHLVRHVREVSLDIPKNSDDQVTLAGILRMLGNIEHLGIHGLSQPWQNIGPALASTISDIISMPSLQRLYLFRIWNIPSAFVLHAASSVSTLSLYRVSAYSSLDDPAIMANTHLEGLFLPSCMMTRVLLPSCPFLLAAQNLRHLAVYVHELGHHRTLSAASSSRLRHLELECQGETISSFRPHVPDKISAFLIPLDLPHLPALRILSLSFMVSESTPGVWTLPYLLRSTITALPTVAPLLDALTFTVLIPFREKYVPWQDRSALPLFDTYSSTNYRQQLPELRGIHCVLRYTDPSAPLNGHFDRAYEGFTGYMETKLRAAHAAGIVTFGRGSQQMRFNYLDNLDNLS